MPMTAAVTPNGVFYLTFAKFHLVDLVMRQPEEALLAAAGPSPALHLQEGSSESERHL